MEDYESNAAEIAAIYSGTAPQRHLYLSPLHFAIDATLASAVVDGTQRVDIANLVKELRRCGVDPDSYAAVVRAARQNGCGIVNASNPNPAVKDVTLTTPASLDDFALSIVALSARRLIVLVGELAPSERDDWLPLASFLDLRAGTWGSYADTRAALVSAHLLPEQGTAPREGRNNALYVNVARDPDNASEYAAIAKAQGLPDAEIKATVASARRAAFGRG